MALAAAISSFFATFTNPNLVPVMIDGAIVQIDIDGITKDSSKAKQFIVTGEDQVKYKVTTVEIGDTTVVIHKLGSEEQRYVMKTQAFKGMSLGWAQILDKSLGEHAEHSAVPNSGKLYAVDVSQYKKAA